MNVDLSGSVRARDSEQRETFTLHEAALENAYIGKVNLLMKKRNKCLLFIFIIIRILLSKLHHRQHSNQGGI